MAGPLKNDRHEAIAQKLAKGSCDFDAYKEAGYNGGRPAASNICSRDDIRARVAEIQAAGARRAEVTVTDIVTQLDEDRKFAREKLAPAAAVSATMAKAKVLGLIVDRQEHTGKGGGPIEYRNLDEDEIDARIAALEAKNAGRSTLAH